LPYIVRSSLALVAAGATTREPLAASWAYLEQRIVLTQARLARSAELVNTASRLLDESTVRIDRHGSAQPDLSS
jgi:hypothetical protein